MIKKVLSSVLSFALVLSLAPMQAMAEPQTQIDTDIPSTTSQPSLEKAANETEAETSSQQDASASIASPSPKLKLQTPGTSPEQPASTDLEASKVSVVFSEDETVATVTLSESDTDLKEALTAISNKARITEIILPEQEITAPTDSSRLFSDIEGKLNFTSLTHIENLSSLNTSSVNNMNGMFYGCTNLTNLDLSDFDTSSVTNMNDMFYFCTNLTNLDLSNFNTSSLTSMDSMFYLCTDLTNLDLSNFNTTKVTDWDNCFHDCNVLTSVKTSDQIKEDVINQITASKIPPRTGFWYLNGKGDPSEKIPALKAGTFLAYEAWTVTFNTNGGSDIESVSVAKDKTFTQPDDPTKEGYAFENWYSDEELTTVFEFTTPITTDTTLYAKWTANEYTVTFNTDGGSKIDPQVINPGGKATEPKDKPTKKDFGFAGWYSDKECKKSFDFDSAITKDTTIYASWYKLFDDVQDVSEFFYPFVYEGAHKGYMTGYKDTNLFGGWDIMDRQTVAVSLYKLAGEPAITQAEINKEMNKFTDANEISSWAKEGIAWCSKTGKFTGTKNGDGTWSAAPAMQANREMIATFLWRYAGEPKAADASKFNAMPDKALVDSWATDGTKWCMEKGIISGVDVPGEKQKYIQPFGSAFRGSMVTMLVRGEKDLI